MVGCVLVDIALGWEGWGFQRNSQKHLGLECWVFWFLFFFPRAWRLRAHFRSNDQTHTGAQQGLLAESTVLGTELRDRGLPLEGPRAVLSCGAFRGSGNVPWCPSCPTQWHWPPVPAGLLKCGSCH